MESTVAAVMWAAAETTQCPVSQAACLTLALAEELPPTLTEAVKAASVAMRRERTADTADSADLAEWAALHAVAELATEAVFGHHNPAETTAGAAFAAARAQAARLGVCVSHVV